MEEMRVSGDSSFSEVLGELDAAKSRIVVRLEVRKFRKRTTVIEGLAGNKEDLSRIARDLKKKFATGGSVKEGVIVLQGDQRDNVRDYLVRMGYSDGHIEVL